MSIKTIITPLINLIINQIDLVLGLLEALNDKNAEVQESVSESLSSLGNKKADFVLKSSFHFVSKNLSKVFSNY